MTGAQEAWLADQEQRPSTCALVDRFVGQPVDRVERLRVITADALVAELIDRLARNFRFAGRMPLMAALEDAYFEAAPPITVGLLAGDDARTVSFESADPRARELTYHDADEARTIGAADLAAIVVYALLPDAVAVERSPDIYADSVRREADPSKGAPLDVVWHGNWQVGGPSYCLLTEGADPSEVERIPYRAELPADEIVGIVADAATRHDRFACAASVLIAPHRGHAITIFGVDHDGVVFHDPWPEGSLLAAGANELGLAATPDGDRWRITTDELRRCLQAVFISPEILAEQQGREYRRSLDDVLGGLGFFNVREVGRTQRDDVWDVEAAPGGFRDEVRIRFAVDAASRLEAALLGLDRSWLQGAGGPFAIDILKSFLAEVVSPLDRPEAAVAIGGVAAVAHGQQAVADALAAGAPHLLGQGRELVLAVLGARESALVTLAFTRIVADNRDQGWLRVGVERAGRTGGPFLVGAQLPAPWTE